MLSRSLTDSSLFFDVPEKLVTYCPFSPADTTSENIIITLCMYIVIAFNSNNIDLTANHTKLISVYDFTWRKASPLRSDYNKPPVANRMQREVCLENKFSFSVSPINSNSQHFK